MSIIFPRGSAATDMIRESDCDEGALANGRNQDLWGRRNLSVCDEGALAKGEVVAPILKEIMKFMKGVKLVDSYDDT